jgi:hypothetical protein
MAGRVPAIHDFGFAHHEALNLRLPAKKRGDGGDPKPPYSSGSVVNISG